MTSIDLFTTRGRFGRAMSNTKIIYSAIRYGAKGVAKVNPVLVCADVALSLADMIQSYSQYRVAKEQTKQLEITRNSLKKQYENFLIELELDKQKLRLLLAKDLEKIDARIRKREHEMHLLKLVYEGSFKALQSIKECLDYYEKRFPYDNAQRVVHLRQQYHEALTAHCQASLNFIGG